MCFGWVWCIFFKHLGLLESLPGNMESSSGFHVQDLTAELLMGWNWGPWLGMPSPLWGSGMVCLYLPAQSHTLSLSSLHRDLQISTPSTLARAAAAPWSSLPARLQRFALCFVFCSALQMLISLLSTSTR